MNGERSTINNCLCSGIVRLYSEENVASVKPKVNEFLPRPHDEEYVNLAAEIIKRTVQAVFCKEIETDGNVWGIAPLPPQMVMVPGLYI